MEKVIMFVTVHWSTYQSDNVSNWAPKGTMTHKLPYTDNERGFLRATTMEGREPNISADYWKSSKNRGLAERESIFI